MFKFVALVFFSTHVSARILCGQSSANLDARMCRELTSHTQVGVCVSTETPSTVTFEQAVAVEDRAAAIEYSAVAQQLALGADFDQQRCMYAWRIARCAASFAPAAASNADNLRACAATCVALRESCSRQSLGLECGTGSDNTRPRCSLSFAALANDECRGDAIDEPPAQQRPPAPRTNAPLPTPPPPPPRIPLPPRRTPRSDSAQCYVSAIAALICTVVQIL